MSDTETLDEIVDEDLEFDDPIEKEESVEEEVIPQETPEEKIAKAIEKGFERVTPKEEIAPAQFSDERKKEISTQLGLFDPDDKFIEDAFFTSDKATAKAAFVSYHKKMQESVIKVATAISRHLIHESVAPFVQERQTSAVSDFQKEVLSDESLKPYKEATAMVIQNFKAQGKTFSSREAAVKEVRDTVKKLVKTQRSNSPGSVPGHVRVKSSTGDDPGWTDL